MTEGMPEFEACGGGCGRELPTTSKRPGCLRCWLRLPLQIRKRIIRDPSPENLADAYAWWANHQEPTDG